MSSETSGNNLFEFVTGKKAFIVEGIFQSIKGIPLIFFVLFIATEFSTDKFFGKNLFDILSGQPLIYYGLMNLLLSLMVWYSFRRLPLFHRSEAGILISFSKLDPELQSSLQNLYARIRADFESNTFKVKIIPRIVPEYARPRKNEDAYRLLEKTGARLVVWGDADYTHESQAKKVVVKPIRFSYAVPSKFAPDIAKDLTRLLRSKNWEVIEGSASSRISFSGDIGEVSYYLIGLMFLFQERFDQASDLLKEIFLTLRSAENITDAQRDILATSEVLLCKIIERRWLRLELWPGSETIKNDLPKATKLIDEQKLLGFSFGVEMLEAQMCIHRNDIVGAKRHLADASKLGAGSAPFLLSSAFMSFYEKGIQRGVDLLNRGLKSELMNDQLMLLARWYEQTMKVQPEKVFLNIPLGLIYFHAGNYMPAKECFEASIDFNRNNPFFTKRIAYMIDKKMESIERKLVQDRRILK